MFRISFQFLGKTYTGKVQKIDQQTVQFIVFEITPQIKQIPDKLVFISNAEADQLIYKSFDVSQAKLIRTIAESIFLTCHQQKIEVHA